MTPMQIKKITFYKKFLLLSDIVVLFSIFTLAYFLRMKVDLSTLDSGIVLFVIVFVNIASLYVFGGYDISAEISTFERFLRVIFSGIIGFSFLVGMIYLTRAEIYGLLGRGVFITSFVLFHIYAISVRYIVDYRIDYLRQAHWNWLALGDEQNLKRLKLDVQKNPILGQLETIIIKKSEDFEKVIKRLKEPWEGIIIASNLPLPDHVSNEFLHYRLLGLQILNLAQVYEHIWRKLPVHYLENQWFLTSDGFNITHNQVGLRIKRLMDISLSLFLFFITWPLFLITMILIKWDSKGPVFFSQKRTGKNGKVFSIIKFRSMKIDAEKEGAQWAQKSDPRVTRVGNIIRLTRIDELPQIYNVLKGDMSFIGPRPERPEFNEKLESQIPYYQMRHLLNPGITGWAQVMYPYGASVEDSIEKLQYELYYIKNYSITLDILIILKTIKIVLFGKGR